MKLFLVLVVLFFIVFHAPGVKFPGVVTIGANIRSGPGLSYPKIASVAAGTEITITGIQGQWLKLSNGWIYAPLVEHSYSIVQESFTSPLPIIIEGIGLERRTSVSRAYTTTLIIAPPPSGN